VCLPALATVVLFAIVLLLIMVPTLERSIIERKKETVRRLTEAAWSVLAECHAEELAGRATREEAQAAAIEQIDHMRYGPGMKDYFWINDTGAHMVAHPYRPDLVGHDLTDMTDPGGKRLFAVVAETGRDGGEGFVEYHWQRLDDSSRIEPKVSYVKGFAPWGWVVGTGLYVEDVKAEVAALTRKLMLLSSGILVLVLLLSGWIVWQIVAAERRRRRAEEGLLAERRQLLSIFDSIDEPIYVSDPRTYELLYANESCRQRWGAETGQPCYKTLHGQDRPCPFCTNAEIFGTNAGRIHVWELRRRQGDRWYRCIDKAIDWPGEQLVRLEMAVDITERKRAEDELQHRVQETTEARRRLEVLVSNIAGRERRMVELKHEVNELLLALGRSVKYRAPEETAELRAAAAPQT
jgi:PAS domain-containing protein